MQALLRHHIALAELFRGWVERDARFDVVAPSPFGLVCFRLRGAGGSADDDRALDAQNRALLARVNSDGSVHLTHTLLAGRYTLRMAVGQLATEQRHVEAAWALVQAAAAEVS